MTQDTTIPRKWIKPRIVLILLALLIVICGSVIATDILSRRDGKAPSQPSLQQPSKP